MIKKNETSSKNSNKLEFANNLKSNILWQKKKKASNIFMNYMHALRRKTTG